MRRWTGAWSPPWPSRVDSPRLTFSFLVFHPLSTPVASGPCGRYRARPARYRTRDGGVYLLTNAPSYSPTTCSAWVCSRPYPAAMKASVLLDAKAAPSSLSKNRRARARPGPPSSSRHSRSRASRPSRVTRRPLPSYSTRGVAVDGLAVERELVFGRADDLSRGSLCPSSLLAVAGRLPSYRTSSSSSSSSSSKARRFGRLVDLGVNAFRGPFGSIRRPL